MEKKVLGQRRSKLGQILDDRNLTLKEFAAMVYEKTGYFIAVTNLSNYCTGFRPLTKTLELPVTDIL
jgi:hypothetical protein